MPDWERIRFHEAGHAVVGVHLGYTLQRMFIRANHQRAGGVDFKGVDAEAFDSEIPVEARWSLAREIIAIYAAGYMAERRQYEGAEMKGWSDEDKEIMESYAIRGVFTNDDMDLLNNSKRRDNGWGKWPDVDRLKAEGEELATTIRDLKWTKVCELVKLLRLAPWLPGARVTEIVGVHKPD